MQEVIDNGRLPDHVQLLYQQCLVAVDCLEKCLQKNPSDSQTVLPYLIHAVTLCFPFRDVMAYELVCNQTAFMESPLPARLRQMPAYGQLIALLNSQTSTGHFAPQLASLSDESLGLNSEGTNLKSFRESVLQGMIPPESAAEANNVPFPVTSVDYVGLAKQLLSAWEKIHNQLVDHYSEECPKQAS